MIDETLVVQLTETELRGLIYSVVKSVIKDCNITGVGKSDNDTICRGMKELADFLKISTREVQNFKRKGFFEGAYWQDGRVILFEKNKVLEKMKEAVEKKNAPARTRRAIK